MPANGLFERGEVLNTPKNGGRMQACSVKNNASGVERNSLHNNYYLPQFATYLFSTIYGRHFLAFFNGMGESISVPKRCKNHTKTDVIIPKHSKKTGFYPIRFNEVI